MILAVPGRDPDSFSEQDEEALQNLPPEPAPPPKPVQPSFPPGRTLPNLTDLESARKEVMAQLDQVCEAWGLVQLSATRAPSVASNRSGDDDFNPILNPTGFQNLQLSSQFSSFKTNHHDHGEVCVINLLALTTRAVRSVQKFILTIPDPDIFTSSNVVALGGGLERRMSHLELSTSARPRTSRSTFLAPSSSALSTSSRSESPTPSISRRVISACDPFELFTNRTDASSITISTNSPAHTAKGDPLTILRKISLEVLGCLKDIEHKFRIPGSATPTDNHELSIGPSDQNHSISHVQTDPKILEHDQESNEGLLLLPSMSWEYRQDINLEEVREEAMVVKRWLECVDGILEGMKIITGTHRSSKRVSSNNGRNKISKNKKSTTPKERNLFKKLLGSSKLAADNSSNQDIKVPDISFNNALSGDESSSGDDEDVEELLPDWARNDRFIVTKSSIHNDANESLVKEDDLLARLFSCLVSHIPTDLLSSLCPPHGENGSRIGFLESLSDGTVLCLAYNIVLRKSQRPWGFIPVETIHNLITPTTIFQASPTLPSPKSNGRSCSPTNLNATTCEAKSETDGRLRNSQDSSNNTRSGPSANFGSSEVGESSFSNTCPSSGSTTMNFTSSAPQKVGMTFRRMENVKVWAAALKLRYSIKSEIPNPCQDQSSTNPSPHTQQRNSHNSINSSHNHHSGSFIKFDPLVIARKSSGWDTMLEFIACKWLNCIRSEKREEILFCSE